MNDDSPRRERRSPLVVILDAMLALAAALQSGHLLRPRPRRRRPSKAAGVAWAVTGVLAAAAGTTILIVAFTRMPGGLSALPPTVDQPAPPSSAVPSQTAPPEVLPPPVTVSPSASPSRTPSNATSAPPVTVERPLAARYSDSEGAPGLLGYRGTVTITNPGSRAKVGWRLTVTLPRPTLRVSEVSGADARQDGSTWTFVPQRATERIPPGGSVEIAFEVRGATLVDATPQDCRIDGNPCAGIAE
jgi:hypothetical protein